MGGVAMRSLLGTLVIITVLAFPAAAATDEPGRGGAGTQAVQATQPPPAAPPHTAPATSGRTAGPIRRAAHVPTGTSRWWPVGLHRSVRLGVDALWGCLHLRPP